MSLTSFSLNSINHTNPIENLPDLDAKTKSLERLLNHSESIKVLKSIPSEELTYLLETSFFSTSNDLQSNPSFAPRRILKLYGGQNVLLLNRKREFEPLGMGAVKKVVLGLNPVSEELHAVLLMNEGICSANQMAIISKVNQIICDQFSKGNLQPVLERFVVGTVDTLDYTSKKGYSRLAIVQEWVKGSDLYKGLTKGMFSGEDTWDIIGQLLEGVAAFHEEGLFIRDIKASNFLWQRDSRTGKIQVKINDFDTSCSKDDPLKTRSTILGTRTYYCHQYLQGKMSDHLDKQDVWALAIVFYLLLKNSQLPSFRKIEKMSEEFRKNLIKVKGNHHLEQKLTESFKSKLIEHIEFVSYQIDQWFSKELKEHPFGKILYKMFDPDFASRISIPDAWRSFQKIAQDEPCKIKFLDLHQIFHSKKRKAESTE